MLHLYYEPYLCGNCFENSTLELLMSCSWLKSEINELRVVGGKKLLKRNIIRVIDANDFLLIIIHILLLNGAHWGGSVPRRPIGKVLCLGDPLGRFCV